jgi:hypothetical protein
MRCSSSGVSDWPPARRPGGGLRSLPQKVEGQGDGERDGGSRYGIEDQRPNASRNAERPDEAHEREIRQRQHVPHSGKNGPGQPAQERTAALSAEALNRDGDRAPDPRDDQRDHAGDREEEHVQPQIADWPRQPEIDGRGERGAAVDRRADDAAAPARAFSSVRVGDRQQAQLRGARRKDALHQRQGRLGRDHGIDQRLYDQSADAPGLDQLERDVGGHGEAQQGQ